MHPPSPHSLPRIVHFEVPLIFWRSISMIHQCQQTYLTIYKRTAANILKLAFVSVQQRQCHSLQIWAVSRQGWVNWMCSVLNCPGVGIWGWNLRPQNSSLSSYIPGMLWANLLLFLTYEFPVWVVQSSVRQTSHLYLSLPTKQLWIPGDLMEQKL